MGLSVVETQILWGSAASINVTTATPQSSDAFSIDPTTIAASIQVIATNAGTPATGDTCTAQIAYTTGDVLANTGDDYDTVDHAATVLVLDTYPTDTPGENPAGKSAPIGIGYKGGKLIVTCPQAATRNISVSARLFEKRSA